MRVFLMSLLASAFTILAEEASPQAPDTIWTRTYGGANHDWGASCQQTADGGYIISGGTWSFGAGDVDAYLVKTDASGDTLWTRTYGGANLDFCGSVRETVDGGYIVAGYTDSFGAGADDVWLIKTDASGDTLWTKTYGGINYDHGLSVQWTSDGGYIIAGYTLSFGAGGADVYLIKTNASGDTLWTRTYGGTSSDYGGCSVQETADGGYIVAGYTSSFGAGSNDFYLIKTDVSGDTLWTRTYGGAGWEIGYSVQQTADGGYILAGYTASFGAGSYDVYLVKTDASGDTLWTRTYGGEYDDSGHSVRETADGGYIVAGWTVSFGAGNRDVYMIKTNASGDTLWTRTYGGTNDDEGYSVQRTADGGYIVAGETNSFGAGSSDVWLLRLNSETGTVDKESRQTPIAIALNQNYPNPFNGFTVIRYELPEQSIVSLEITDILGRIVAIPLEGVRGTGGHTLSWYAADLPSGVYLARLKAGSQFRVIRMTLVK